MLLEVRRLNVLSADLDDLVSALTIAELWAAKYVALQIETPEWLGERVLDLRREITARNRDRIAMLLRQKRLQLGNLKTRDERKADLAAEIVKLEQQLAG